MKIVVLGIGFGIGFQDVLEVLAFTITKDVGEMQLG